jgi:hypothetical protein
MPWSLREIKGELLPCLFLQTWKECTALISYRAITSGGCLKFLTLGILAMKNFPFLLTRKLYGAKILLFSH